MAQQQMIRAAILPPSSRLALAISEFEADLSTEQKINVHQVKTRTPDIDDVIRLTAEIDQSRTTGGGRCYGLRLLTFLQGLQQFASIGDVLIGGSQNLIACGVWSVVRFSLLTITKYTAYVERLSDLFMSLGRMTPRFQDLAALYTQSIPLQNSVLEYYIVVVRVCHEILRFSKKSTFGAILTNFGHTLDSYSSDLNRKVESIKTELHLEAIKEAKSENKKNITFRALSLRNIQLQKIARQQASKQRILDACSVHDYQTTWKQTKKIGNTSSFKQEESYLDWAQRKSSCTLVYSGKLGFGKSVLLANVVNDLYLEHKDNVAYFFCRHDINDSLHARTIIGCLAKQILQHHPDLDFLYTTTKVDLESKNFDIDELVELIQHSVSGPIHFVLDGLDECATEEQRITMHYLGRLQKVKQLLICVATRFIAEDTIAHYIQDQQDLLHATIPAVNLDIEAYVQLEIENRIVSGDLRVSGSALILEIKKRLIEGAQGMFLWVDLQIRSLCLMESDYAIQKALTDLPQGLAETYSRLLQQHDKTQYQRNILELILAAFRPLTVEELREALSVEPGNIEYDPTRLINSIDRVLQSCGGLVIVDDEEKTVRLVHSSTRQFLTTDFKEPIEHAVAKKKLGEIVLTYLNYSLLETQVSRSMKSGMMTASIPAAILISKFPRARKFVESSKNQKLNETIESMAMSGRGIQTRLQNQFQSYAQNYWARHVVLFGENSYQLHLHRLLQSALLKKRVNIHETGDDALTPLQLGAQNGPFGLVELLLTFSPTQQDKQKAAILGAIEQRGRTVSILVHHMDESLQLDALFFEALAIDAELLVSALLMEDRISKNPRNKDGESPVMFAVKRNMVGMVKILADNDLIMRNECSDLVKIAIEQDFQDVMRELSKDQIVKDVYYEKTAAASLWSWIFSTNHISKAMMNVLLDNGILSYNNECKRGWILHKASPLVVAAEEGRADLVEWLLARGDVDINRVFGRNQRFSGGLKFIEQEIVNVQARTALDLASSNEVIDLLRAAGGLTAEEIEKQRLHSQQ